MRSEVDAPVFVNLSLIDARVRTIRAQRRLRCWVGFHHWASLRSKPQVRWCDRCAYVPRRGKRGWLHAMRTLTQLIVLCEAVLPALIHSRVLVLAEPTFITRSPGMPVTLLSVASEPLNFEM